MTEWQPIETLLKHQEALVSVTYNLPDGEWATVMWTDWFDDRDGWFRYPRLVEIPFPPTHWMPLPEPPHD